MSHQSQQNRESMNNNINTIHSNINSDNTDNNDITSNNYSMNSKSNSIGSSNSNSNSNSNVISSVNNNNSLDNMTTTSINSNNAVSVPTAPYPPMNFRQGPPSSSSSIERNLKSSLSPSPHYSSNIASYKHRNPSDLTGNTPHGTMQSSSSKRGTSSLSRGSSNLDPSDGGDDEMSSAPSGMSISEQLPKAARGIPIYSSQVKFFPSLHDTLACINCITSDPSPSGTGTIAANTNKAPSTHSTLRNRKLGPMLLELRQLEIVNTMENNESVIKQQPQSMTDFFTTRTIGISRGKPSFGSSVASTSLDLANVYSYGGRYPLAGATGLTTGALCIHTFGEEFDEDQLLSSSIEYYHAPNSKQRQASAVAWRPHNSNHVAIGLLGSSSSAGTQQGPVNRRGTTGMRAGADREFCCFLWDVEAQSSPSLSSSSAAAAAAASKRTLTPLYKLSHNAAVASLAWLLEGQTLAVGGQLRNIQLFDLRLSGTNAPPISAYAHNFGVHGIQVDPHRPNLMASFCRSVGEPVKLWDIRRMDSVVSEIKITGASTKLSTEKKSSMPSSDFASSVKWSSLEPGVLSVAIGDSVLDYDTMSGSRPVLTRVNYSKDGKPIVDITLYEGSRSHRRGSPKDHENTKTISNSSRLIADLYHNRMLVVHSDRTVCDMPKHTNAPVAISRRDGRLVHALGGTVWVGPTNEGPAAMESLTIRHDEDISATMLRRAQCFHAARYSMDTASNIKMLSEEMPVGARILTDSPSARFTLLRLWSWIDRVEALCSEAEDLEDDAVWPARGLVDAGVWNLLGLGEKQEMMEELVFSKALSCSIFRSPERRSALTACGWAGKFDIINVLAECEALGEYERSAALAVWHGEIGAAVDALQRGSDAFRRRLEEKSKNSPLPVMSEKYAEMLDLIAMCIAGYGGTAASSSQVWRTACSSLLRRDIVSGESSKISRVAYLRSLCQFLMSVSIDGGQEQVLGNVHLSLCDRIGFACNFLPQNELQTYLSKCIEMCQATGNIEGLVITGLSKNGIKILQAYMDRHTDVQTVALVVSRVVLPPDWTTERRICTEWVESYRGLLNTWQMWQSRAMFDVDRAEKLRHIKAKYSDGLPSSSGKAANYQTRRLQHSNRRQNSRVIDPDILPSMPAQLDARCNYCSSPLGLRRHEGNPNQWLSKMKSVLSCCPQCRKPLPRCAICLLSLGVLNPYMELTRDRARPGPRGASMQQLPDDLSSLANLPFAEWFTWCMRCKHGGHAHHMVGWFANHEACPVSGCECCCQFDGIQKLSRPALSKKYLSVGATSLSSSIPLEKSTKRGDPIKTGK